MIERDMVELKMSNIDAFNEHPWFLQALYQMYINGEFTLEQILTGLTRILSKEEACNIICEISGARSLPEKPDN